MKLKLEKKYLKRLCLVEWDDAKGQFSASLEAFIKSGLCINTTVGWLMYYNNKFIVVCTENSTSDESLDLVMIPRGWVRNIKWLKEA